MKFIMCFTLACMGLGAVAGEFKVGFSRVDITPPLGADMPGYFSTRLATGADTPLEAECLALTDGCATSLVFSVDNIHLTHRDVARAREGVGRALGVSAERIFIASTHIHTCAATDTTYYNLIKDAEVRRLVDVYGEMLATRLVDAARKAVNDWRAAEMAVARTACPGLSFIRRFRMKDGSVQTNPADTTQIDHALGTSDDTLQLVRFSRTGAPDIALVNFQCHPDTIGGTHYNADWPGVLRHTFEQALADGTHCFFINGAQGDSNHYTFVGRTKGRAALLNRKGAHICQHMGRALAGAALGLWDECVPLAAGAVKGGIATARVPSNRPTAEEIRWIKLHDAGHDDQIPVSGMQLMTLVAPGSRARRLMNGPDHFDLPVSAVTVGGALAFAGFPGEPFTEIGRRVKMGSPFAVTIVACLVNDSFGYFPTTESYAEGGYEVLSSKFAAPIGDTLIRTQLQQLKELYQK